MNVYHFFRRMFLPFLVLSTMLACMTAVPASPTISLSTVTQEPETESAFTETRQPSLTAEVNLETAVTGTGPSCTILQDLNLRSGPGMAYRPPIKALPGDSTVTPLGFAPQGIPGGTWAYVEEPATGQKGWVSADSQYISCTVELASLPAVDFGTPPPPAFPKSTQTSNPDGNGFCVDQPSEYQCAGIFSEASLFQFQIFKDGVEQGENDGIEPVLFTVFRIPSGDPTNKVVVYERTENQKPYCVFGGSGPCNGWIIEDGTYKWTAGGTPVEPGEYEMEVNTAVNGQTSRWAVNFTLTLP